MQFSDCSRQAAAQFPMSAGTQWDMINEQTYAAGSADNDGNDAAPPAAAAARLRSLAAKQPDTAPRVSPSRQPRPKPAFIKQSFCV